MIRGGVDWTAGLNDETKRPLYIFTIPNLDIALCSFFPLDLITGGDDLLPVLRIPAGAAQKIDELTGHSSISGLEITAIDPAGQLKALAADVTALSQPCQLLMGFPGLDLADFIGIHVGRIAKIGRSAAGVMTIAVSDLLLDLVNDVFLNGGPDAWTVGQAVNDPPSVPPALLDNGQPISEDNPRYLSGNPMDILLAVMQNELGIGQDDPPVLAVNTGGGSGTGQAGYAINPTWTFYDGSTGLIDPNPYVDVAGIVTLRDTQFAGDRMEFTLTDSQRGKSWIEDQILKPLGLYWITRASGQLALKGMKHIVSDTGATPIDSLPVAAATLDDSQILGIPELDRLPIINMIQASLPVSNDDTEDQASVQLVQQNSLNVYRSPYSHTINADGLRLGLGAFTRIFLLSNRIFNRHAFGTPVYTIKTFLKHFVLELGDFIALTHPLVLDLATGELGITERLCEIVDRQPDYAAGHVTFKVIDTGFLAVPNGAFEIADAADSIPDWGSASGAQKLQYMFISKNNGTMSDGADGNEIA